jgi:parallel beta-helix repeat protein
VSTTLIDKTVRDLHEESSYIIFQEGGLVHAKNGGTGQIDFSGPDAAAVIQAAINALTNGGKIFIKSATYVIKTTLIISHSGIEVVGERGAVLKPYSASEPDPLIRVANVDSVRISNLKLDGGTAYTKGVEVYNCTNFKMFNCEVITFRRPIYIDTGTGISLESCVFKGLGTANPSGGLSIYVTGVTGFRLVGCEVAGGEHNGLGYGAIDFIIAYNYFHDNYDDVIDFNGAKHGLIVGNVFRDNQYYLSLEHECSEIAIVGNLFYNNYGISITDCQRISISGNAGDFSPDGYVIQITHGAETAPDLITIVGNQFYNSWYGAKVSGATRVAIVGNTFKHRGDYPAIALENSQHCVVEGNMLKDAPQGIVESGTSDYNVIQNNNVINVVRNRVVKVGANTRVGGNVGYDTENFKATGVSVAVGTGGTYGSASAITSPSGRVTLPRIKITWSGTFGTGETVTVKVEAVYSDGSTAYVEKSATAVGSQWLTDDDVLALITQGKDIVKLNVYAKSSAASTTVTVSVDAYGKA